MQAEGRGGSMQASGKINKPFATGPRCKCVLRGLVLSDTVKCKQLQWELQLEQGVRAAGTVSEQREFGGE